jgi:hypothetical protein
MKKNLLIKILTACIIGISIIGCTKSPSETDIFNLVNKKYGRDLVISIDLKNKGAKQKRNDKTVFAYTLGISYIRGGLAYGYVSGCPEKHCCKDTEYSVEIDYLIGKNQWDEWELYDSRTINRKEVDEYWRPASKSLKEFYKDRISN